MDSRVGFDALNPLPILNCIPHQKPRSFVVLEEGRESGLERSCLEPVGMPEGGGRSIADNYPRASDEQALGGCIRGGRSAMPGFIRVGLVLPQPSDHAQCMSMNDEIMYSHAIIFNGATDITPSN